MVWEWRGLPELWR